MDITGKNGTQKLDRHALLSVAKILHQPLHPGSDEVIGDVTGKLRPDFLKPPLWTKLKKNAPLANPLPPEAPVQAPLANGKDEADEAGVDHFPNKPNPADELIRHELFDRYRAEVDPEKDASRYDRPKEIKITNNKNYTTYTAPYASLIATQPPEIVTLLDQLTATLEEKSR